MLARERFSLGYRTLARVYAVEIGDSRAMIDIQVVREPCHDDDRHSEPVDEAVLVRLSTPHVGAPGAAYLWQSTISEQHVTPAHLNRFSKFQQLF